MRIQVSLSSNDQIVYDVPQWVAEQCVTLMRLNKRVTDYNLDKHNMYQVMNGRAKLGVLNYHNNAWHYMLIDTDVARVKDRIADLHLVKELKGV